MADIFDELVKGGVPPDALVSALRRQNALGGVAALSGDKTISRMGGYDMDTAMHSAEGLRDQRVRNQAREDNQAFQAQQQAEASADRKLQRDYQYTALKQAREIAAAQQQTARDVAGLRKSAAAGKPKTEGEKRAELLGKEMIDAETQLRTIPGGTEAGTSLLQRAADTNFVTRPFTGDTFKRQNAAATRWAQNYLYLKSGQAAPAEEVRKTELQYTPQANDGPEVIAQKAQARIQAMQGVGNIYGVKVPNFDAKGPVAEPPDMDAYYQSLTGAQ